MLQQPPHLNGSAAYHESRPSNPTTALEEHGRLSFGSLIDSRCHHTRAALCRSVTPRAIIDVRSICCSASTVRDKLLRLGEAS